jgi:hypothetical protein
MLNSLRNILRKLEGALSSLGGMTGLPANVIAQASAYLAAAAKFVDDVAHLLESTVLDAAAKAKQILAWASAIVPPEIQGSPTVQAILNTVQTAIEGFLRFFQVTSVPAYTLSSGDKALVSTIATEAETDGQMVKRWAAKAAGGHSRLRYHAPRIWEVTDPNQMELWSPEGRREAWPGFLSRHPGMMFRT